jgi:hypothetical protein
VLRRSFEVEFEAFGTTQKAELMPGGSDVRVTAHNRGQFVDLYAAWLLSGSVAEQFAAFASGFHRVCGGPALSLFRWVRCAKYGLSHTSPKAAAFPNLQTPTLQLSQRALWQGLDWPEAS